MLSLTLVCLGFLATDKYTVGIPSKTTRSVSISQRLFAARFKIYRKTDDLVRVVFRFAHKAIDDIPRTYVRETSSDDLN